MRTRVFAVAGASAALLVGLLTGQATAQQSLPEQVDSLEVAQEDRSGYDRDAFGDYDRDALLEQNFNAFPSCDGYYSVKVNYDLSVDQAEKSTLEDLAGDCEGDTGGDGNDDGGKDGKSEEPDDRCSRAAGPR